MIQITSLSTFGSLSFAHIFCLTLFSLGQSCLLMFVYLSHTYMYLFNCSQFNFRTIFNLFLHTCLLSIAYLHQSFVSFQSIHVHLWFAYFMIYFIIIICFAIMFALVLLVFFLLDFAFRNKLIKLFAIINGWKRENLAVASFFPGLSWWPDSWLVTQATLILNEF